MRTQSRHASITGFPGSWLLLVRAHIPLRSATEFQQFHTDFTQNGRIGTRTLRHHGQHTNAQTTMNTKKNAPSAHCPPAPTSDCHWRIRRHPVSRNRETGLGGHQVGSRTHRDRWKQSKDRRTATGATLREPQGMARPMARRYGSDTHHQRLLRCLG
jgi:hypothetical protein